MRQLSSKLKAVMTLAQEEANRFDMPFVETWHLLLGMLGVYDSVAGMALMEFEEQVPVENYLATLAELIGKEPREDLTSVETLPYSQGLERLFEEGEMVAQLTGSDELGTQHLLMALLLNREVFASQVLILSGFTTKDEDQGPRLADLRRSLVRLAGFSKEDLKAIHEARHAPSHSGPKFSDMMKPQSMVGEVEDFTRDLTDLARRGLIEPVVGRDQEVSRMIQVLSRKTKNNPVLVGDAGVGKTALAYGLALRIASGEIPLELMDFRVLEIDMMSVVAGTRFRGDFEERMNQLIADIEEDGKIILFIDELHTIMGSGSGMDSTLDAANILKPALSRGRLRLLGATTQDEYQKHIEKDAALSRRFAKILIEEPSQEDAYRILEGLRSSYETYHRVTIPDQTLWTAVKFAHRYLTNKNLPDSAIDLLDEASATVQNRVLKKRPPFLSYVDVALMNGDMKEASRLLKIAEKSADSQPLAVTEDDILETLSKLSGIPVTKLSQSETKKYLNLEKNLHQRVIGQEEAVSSIARAIRRNQSGIRTGKRPIGSFLFLGPTGVGKTELAKALAELLFVDESALIRFDMSEYMEKFAASRLNGAPPGYVGYEEGGELTEKVRQKPYSVLLFDEVEKAHPDIFNVLLQVLDDGVLTDSRGRKVDFSNTIIIMTSNLGATALRDDKTVGFGAKSLSHDHDAMEKRILEELKKAYRPEFINRIDEKVVFHSLQADQMLDIVKIMVKPLVAVLAEKGLTLKFQSSALKWLAKEGYNPEMGARPLRRLIQTKVEDQLAELLLSGDFQEGQTLKVGVAKDKLKFDLV